MHSPARFALFLAAALAAALVATAVQASPVIPTYSHQWGNSGNGPGQFILPISLAADAVGNVWVVDSGRNRVKKFDAVGNQLQEIGTFGTGNGQFNSCYGVAAAADGGFYVSEFTGARIQKFTSAGAYAFKWGSPGTGDGQFSQLRCLALDDAGNVYAVDSGNNRIQKFDAAGNFILKWGTAGGGPGGFDRPTQLAIDPKGFVYVTDTYNHRVQKFTADGAFVAEWGVNGSGPGEFVLPTGIACDAVGNVYVGEAIPSRIQKFTGDGTYLGEWGAPGTGDGQFDGPNALSIDSEGNVYVADTNNERIQKFSAAGMAESRWAPTYAFNLPGPNDGNHFGPNAIAGGPAPYVFVMQTTGVVRARSFGGGTYDVFGSFGSGDGQFSLARGLAVSASGDLYVADTGNHRIQRLGPNGAFISKWGTLGSGIGQFNEPAAIAIDASNHVFVVDQLNRRVQKFLPNGTWVGEWGSFGSGNGQFDFPTGIAVDRNGAVYVSDHNNARVQKFTGDGVYITQWALPIGATPDNIAIDAAGNVWVPTGTGGWVFRYSTGGVLLTTFNLGAGTVPVSVGVDPGGSVYFGDQASGRVMKYVTSPSVAIAADVPGDEGQRVTLRIRPSSGDTPNSGVTVLGYDVYLLGAASAAGSVDDGARLNAYLVPATGAAEYLATVSTVDDATAAALEHGAFMVRAWTGPYTYYDSELHPAMSVDNLPPPVPGPFVVSYQGGGAHLHWNLSPAADFETFRLYRSMDPAFVPGPGTLLAATIDTGYVDPAQPGYTYKLSAVDEHGNESLFAVLGPSGIVGVPGEPALAFGLEPVRPNPIAAGRALTVRFTLPRAEAGRIELVNVAGRRVAAREVAGAGTHVVDLSAERRESGVYFVRLVQGADVAVRRIVVLD
jgi:sugar lactone lactonase YvrE